MTHQGRSITSAVSRAGRRGAGGFSIRRTAALACVALAGFGGQALAAGAPAPSAKTPPKPTKPAPSPTSDGSQLANPAVDQLISTVPQTTLDAIGLGTQAPGDLATTKLSGAPLTRGGVPEVLLGSLAWCPHCATGNVAVAIALSHFGALNQLASINTGPYYKSLPDINGLSFDGSAFSSPTITFTDVILQTRSAVDYETPTKAQDTAFVASGAKKKGFPVVDVGGAYGFSGVPFNPDVAKGMTTLQIAQALADPTSPVAQDIDGYSNLLTAAICATTAQQPTAVCTTAGATAAAAGL